MASSLKKTEGWGRLAKVISQLPKEMQEAREKGLKQIGLKAERLALLHMKKQDLSWQDLDKKYVLRKVKKGHSNKTLIASSEYFLSITSFSNKNTAFAGVKRDAKSKDGESLVSIAAVHEFGNKNMPSRPLWRPVFKETMKWVKTEKPFARIAVANLKKIK